ncbi:MAG TPA: CAP domain-containing protein [Candidatus Limnocylindrales bacterium]
MRRAFPRIPRRVLAIFLAGIVTAMIGMAPGTALASGSPSPTANTNPPNSPSSSTVETYIRTWLNRDRSSRGLRPLRVDVNLRAIATTRAGTLASLGLLSHSAPGNLASQLNSAGVRWYGWGEDIGWSSFTWGHDVASSLYTMWRHSPAHWSLMMSSHYNYLGVGLGYRWPDGATYASIVFAELPDHTGPSARLTAAGRTGTSVWFHYTGTDTLLQTRTSGLRDFDLAYRVDGGAWTIIRTHRTAVSITLASRARGHTYYMVVRARDRAGNISSWSSPAHVTVP